MRTTPVTRLIAVAAAGLLVTIAAGGVAVASHQFRDVPNSHWAHGEIGWLVDNGIARGFDDGTFRPRDYINRQQAAFWFSNLVSQIELVSEEKSSSFNVTAFSQSVDCPSGKQAVGGGGFAGNPWVLRTSYPIDTGQGFASGWEMSWTHPDGGSAVIGNYAVYVICMPRPAN